MPSGSPGNTPALGTITVVGDLTHGHGANAGLWFHPQGHRAVLGWCGAESSVELWSLDPPKELSSHHAEVEMDDVGGGAAASIFPPGVPLDTEWSTHVLPVLDLAMSGHGDRFAVAAGKSVRVFDLAPDDSSLVSQVALRGHRGAVARAAMTDDGGRVMAAEGEGQITVWSVEDQEQLHRFRISRSPRVARFIWNDMLALVGDHEGRIICWELQRGKRHLQFQAHHGAVNSADFSAAKGTLLTVGEDGCARLWNLEAGKQVANDLGHRGIVHDGCFAYAGRFVITASEDHHLGIWDTDTGNLLDWVKSPTPIYRIAFRKMDGAILLGGPNAVSMVRVDWQRLASIDPEQFSATPTKATTEMSSVPEAPSATYNPRAYGEAAPVGLIMKARQTVNLPMADRSQLELHRGQAGPEVTGPPQPPPPPSPVSGPVLAFGGGSPVAGPGARKSRAKSFFSSSDKSTEIDPLLAAAAADIPKATLAQDDEEPAVIGSVSGLRLSSSHQAVPTSPSESGLLRTTESGLHRANEPAAGASREKRRRKKKKASAGAATDRGELKFFITAAVVVLTVAVGAFFAVNYLFANVLVPGSIAAEIEAAEAAYTAIEENENEDMEGFVESQEDVLRGYERSQNMTITQLENARAASDRRVESRRADMNERLASAAEVRDSALAALDDERSSIAQGRAVGALLVTMVLGLALAVMRFVRRKSS